MDKFRAFRINEEDGKIVAGFEELSIFDLTPGNVVIKVSHSTINYKDALAATGTGKILRRYPLVGGIDLAGTVVTSDDEDFQPGDAVLVNGCGLSETIDGGYAEYATAGVLKHDGRAIFGAATALKPVSGHPLLHCLAL